jgi:hypothetical protein
LNVGNHHLGSSGYDGKEAIWEKEDAELRAQGKENPFNKFENRQAKNFIRARYCEDPKTKQLVTDAKVKKLEELMVRNLPA